MGMIIGIAVVVVVLVVGGIVGYKKFAAPAKATTYIEVNAVPWGTIKTVVSKDGKVKIDVNEATPARVPVPAGEYTVTVAGPDGKEMTEDVNATDDQPGSTSKLVFQQIDVERIVNEH